MTHTVERPLTLTRTRSSRSATRVPRGVWTAGGFAAVLLLWQAAAASGLEAVHILPSPVSVVRALLESWPVLAASLPATASTAALGFVWGAGLAILVGLVAALSKSVEAVVVRTAIVADSLPTIALAPILMIVASGNTPGVVMAAISVFFLTLMSFVAGLGHASPQAIEMNRAFGGGALSELWSIRVRYALPSLLSGLMLSAPAAVVGALMSEFLIMGRGLGGALIAAQEELAADRVWAISLVCALLSGALFFLLSRARRVLAPWVGEQTQEYRPARASTRGPVGSILGTLVSAAVSLVVVLGFWYLCIGAFGLNAYFAKTPVDVWNYLFTASDAGGNRAEIVGYLATTSVKALLGLLLGTGLALALAWLAMSFWRVEATVMPVLIGFRAVPLLALIPVISLLAPNGYVTAVIVAAIMSFFATLINVVHAASLVPRDILHLGEAYNAGPMTMRWKVHRLYVTPAIFTSLKITVPGALIGAMSAEWLATGDGIGHLMIQAAMESRYTTMWSSFVVLTLFSVSLYACVTIVERLVVRRLQ